MREKFIPEFNPDVPEHNPERIDAIQEIKIGWERMAKEAIDDIQLTEQGKTFARFVEILKEFKKEGKDAIDGGELSSDQLKDFVINKMDKLLCHPKRIQEEVLDRVHRGGPVTRPNIPFSYERVLMWENIDGKEGKWFQTATNDLKEDEHFKRLNVNEQELLLNFIYDKDYLEKYPNALRKLFVIMSKYSLKDFPYNMILLIKKSALQHKEQWGHKEWGIIDKEYGFDNASLGAISYFNERELRKRIKESVEEGVKSGKEAALPVFDGDGKILWPRNLHKE